MRIGQHILNESIRLAAKARITEMCSEENYVLIIDFGFQGGIHYWVRDSKNHQILLFMFPLKV